MSQLYSNIDKLAGRVRSKTLGTRGSSILSLVVILSGVLSALFFWSFSQRVFSGVWQPLGLVLGLVTGLLPSEGAFFGWRAIRNTKVNMTQIQLDCTKWGVNSSIATAVFSTFALFVAQFPQVPADIAQYTDWFVFIALSFPLIIQMVIIARFEINERDTVENFERSKLGAVAFDAYINAEQARMQSIIDGMNRKLDRTIGSYGDEVGEVEADKILGDGGKKLLSMSDTVAVPSQSEEASLADVKPHEVLALIEDPTPLDVFKKVVSMMLAGNDLLTIVRSIENTLGATNLAIEVVQQVALAIDRIIIARTLAIQMADEKEIARPM